MTTSTFNPDTIIEALPRVRAEFQPTPLTRSEFLSETVGHDIFIKWDNKLRTGSYKERGAINFIGSLNAEERAKGLCAASAGNHAMAVSFYAQKAKIPCTIVMPTWAPLVKIRSTTKFGSKVLLHGSTFDEAYAYAQNYAQTHGLHYVPGFDDHRIIAGAGTLGLELFEQLDDFDSVIIPIGGGGLIAGVASAIKAKKPHIKVIGVQSQWIVDIRNLPPQSPYNPLGTKSIADGIAVKNIGKLNAPIIKEKVDSIVTVSESQIAQAIIALLELEKTVVEGAGAATIAALLSNLIDPSLKKTVAVVCGSNIDMNVISRLIMRDLSLRNRLLRFTASVPDRPGTLNYLTSIISELGANVLEVFHDRSFSEVPGNVSIQFILEVRDREHKDLIVKNLEEKNVYLSEVR